MPSLYEVRYDEPCSPHGYTVPREGKDVPPVVYKRVVEDFGATNPLSQSCVPYAQLVHDRLSIEILRGCARGCRFCQAGMTYRPVRERSADQIVSSVIQGLEKTGYDEVSLTSLSTTDTPASATCLAGSTAAWKIRAFACPFPRSAWIRLAWIWPSRSPAKKGRPDVCPRGR